MTEMVFIFFSLVVVSSRYGIPSDQHKPELCKNVSGKHSSKYLIRKSLHLLKHCHTYHVKLTSSSNFGMVCEFLISLTVQL